MRFAVNQALAFQVSYCLAQGTPADTITFGELSFTDLRALRYFALDNSGDQLFPKIIGQGVTCLLLVGQSIKTSILSTIEGDIIRIIKEMSSNIA